MIHGFRYLYLISPKFNVRRGPSHGTFVRNTVLKPKREKRSPFGSKKSKNNTKVNSFNCQYNHVFQFDLEIKKGTKRKIDDSKSSSSKKKKNKTVINIFPPLTKIKKEYKKFLESPSKVIKSIQFRPVMKRDGLRLTPIALRLKWNFVLLHTSNIILSIFNECSKGEQLILNQDDCWASFALVSLIEEKFVAPKDEEFGITTPGHYGRRSIAVQVLNGQSNSKVLMDAEAYAADPTRDLRNQDEDIFQFCKNLSEMPAAWREIYFQAIRKFHFVIDGPWLRAFQVCFSIKGSSLNTYSYTYRQMMRFWNIAKWAEFCHRIRSEKISEIDSLRFAMGRLVEGYGIRTVFNGISALNTLASQMGRPWNNEYPRLKQAFRKAFHSECGGGDGLDKKENKQFIMFLKGEGRNSRLTLMVYLLYKGCFIFLLRCVEGLYLPWYLLRKGKFPDAEGTERSGVKALVQNAKTRKFDEPPQEVLVFDNKEFWNPGTYYKELVSTARSNTFIFVDESGDLLKPSAVYKEFKRLVKKFKKSVAKESEIQSKRIVLHSARISMIALLFSHGFHILVIRELARHAWIQTTVGYLRKSPFLFGNTYCLKKKLREINLDIERGKVTELKRHISYPNTSDSLHLKPRCGRKKLNKAFLALKEILRKRNLRKRHGEVSHTVESLICERRRVSESIRDSFDGIRLLTHEPVGPDRNVSLFPPPLEEIPNMASSGMSEKPRGILKFFKRIPDGKTTAIKEVSETEVSLTDVVVKGHVNFLCESETPQKVLVKSPAPTNRRKRRRSSRSRRVPKRYGN